MGRERRWDAYLRFEEKGIRKVTGDGVEEVKVLEEVKE